MNLKVDNRLSYLRARFRYLARDVKSTSSSLSSALSELISIRQELDAYIADSSVSEELDAMRAEIPNIFHDLIVPVSSQIDGISALAKNTDIMAAMTRIDTVLYSLEPVTLEYSVNIKRYLASINIAGQDPTVAQRDSTILPGDAALIRCALPDNPTQEVYIAGILVSQMPNISSGLSGIKIFRLANRVDAASVGKIRISGLSSADGDNPAKWPRSFDFIPQAPVWLPSGTADPEQQGINRYSIVVYNPPQLIGKNIYIQSNEPTDPDCVWIDTNGIDLILE